MTGLRPFHKDWGEPVEGVAYGDVEYELLRSGFSIA